MEFIGKRILTSIVSGDYTPYESECPGLCEVVKKLKSNLESDQTIVYQDLITLSRGLLSILAYREFNLVNLIIKLQYPQEYLPLYLEIIQILESGNQTQKDWIRVYEHAVELEKDFNIPQNHSELIHVAKLYSCLELGLVDDVQDVLKVLLNNPPIYESTRGLLISCLNKLGIKSTLTQFDPEYDKLNPIIKIQYDTIDYPNYSKAFQDIFALLICTLPTAVEFTGNFDSNTEFLRTNYNFETITFTNNPDICNSINVISKSRAFIGLSEDGVVKSVRSILGNSVGYLSLSASDLYHNKKLLSEIEFDVITVELDVPGYDRSSLSDYELLCESVMGNYNQPTCDWYVHKTILENYPRLQNLTCVGRFAKDIIVEK